MPTIIIGISGGSSTPEWPPMPMFYFDIVQIDGTFIKDSVGIELASTEAARIEAKRCLAEMLEQAVNDDLSELRIEVRNSAGETVALRAAHLTGGEGD